MIHIVSIFILAFAVSLDSFGVGITYGLRKVYIPLVSILIISMCSGITIILSMLLGQGISLFISPKFAEILGGLILIGIGAWALYNNLRTNYEPVDTFVEKQQAATTDQSALAAKKVWTIELKKLGIVIQILRKPMMADIDRSGVISGKEAIVLGIALSLDAFGAGIGAALLGYSPLLVALVMAFMSSAFVFLGVKCGAFLSKRTWMAKLSYAPGVILMIFGIFKII